ncbi:MAG: hypothetical protein PHU12_01255 [Candidatus Aenigmarchaeota archaeon]|nr:hypothetical protein [Candidatus Aenigmarchaeota archaeon]
MLTPMDVSKEHYKSIEKTKTKARSLMKKLVAINQTTSILVGKLEAADIEKLGSAHMASCKLTLSNAKRYSVNNKFDFKMEEESIAFVNRPEMLMTIDELGNTHPEILRETHVNIRKGVWDGIETSR